MAEGKHEEQVRFSILITTPNVTHGSVPAENRFVTLKSGESYDSDPKFVGFVLIRSSEVGRLSKANHILQVRVSTWNEPAALAQELVVVWRKYGVLWWQDVTSQPMPFKIERASSPIKCS